MNRLHALLALASLVGAGLAAAYIFENRGIEGGVCVIGGGACQSSYSLGWLTLPLIGRVHLSWIALAYFTILAGLFSYTAVSGRALGARIALVLLAAGASTIPYLAYLQAYRVGRLCLYCTGMYVVIAACLVASWWALRRRG